MNAAAPPVDADPSTAGRTRAQWSAVALAFLVPVSLAGPAVTTYVAPLLAVLLLCLGPPRWRPAQWVLAAACAGAAGMRLLGLPWQTLPTFALVLVAGWALQTSGRTSVVQQVRRHLPSRPDRVCLLVGLATLAFATAFLLTYFQLRGQFTFVHLPYVALVLVPLGNAVLEEVIWRGAMLGLLLEAGIRAPVAICLQALSFGWAHWNSGIPAGPWGAVSSALFGLALGFVAQRSRSLAIPVFVHWCVDMVIFFSLFR